MATGVSDRLLVAARSGCHQRFLQAVKTSVDSKSDVVSFEERVDKYLYAYSWLLGHVRQGLLDDKLLGVQLAKIEKQLAQRVSEMMKDLKRTQ
jgi:hypothetical protein